VSEAGACLLLLLQCMEQRLQCHEGFRRQLPRRPGCLALPLRGNGRQASLFLRKMSEMLRSYR